MIILAFCVDLLPFVFAANAQVSILSELVRINQKQKGTMFWTQSQKESQPSGHPRTQPTGLHGDSESCLRQLNAHKHTVIVIHGHASLNFVGGGWECGGSYIVYSVFIHSSLKLLIKPSLHPI